jgi:hypothetical protein
MTIRDPEVLEALRERPELLAIADAVTETQRPPRASRSRVLTRSAAVVAVGAAVLIAVLLWPSGGKQNPILERALAAIGDGRVMHVLLQTPSGYQVVELRGGRTITPRDEVEIWSDRSSKRARAITRDRGRVVAETLIPEDDHGLGEPDPAFSALWTGYRNALANGSAKLIGKGSIYGHDVYWLQFPLPDHGGPGSRVAVDQDSYRPVAIYGYAGGSGFIHEQVLLARTEPFSESDFRRQTARPHPLQSGTRVSTGVPTHPLHLGKPWLAPGPSIRGVKLTYVAPLSVTTGKRRSRGVELFYGFYRVRGGAKWIRIDELKKPTNSEWRGIPSGYVKILPLGEEHVSSGTTKEIWTGKLVVNGIYVTIETDLGRDALLAVARALKPL